MEDEEIHRIHVAVGEALSEWSQVEKMLVFCFAEIVPVRNPTVPWIIFTSIINMDARIKLMNELIPYAGLSKDGFAAWGWLYNRLTRCNKARNELAHFTIGAEIIDGIRYPTALMPFFQANFARFRSKRLTSSQITDRTRRFGELAEDLYWLLQQFPRIEGRPVPKPEPMPERVTLHLQAVRSTPQEGSPPPQSFEA
ncbi:MAG TPA: hypothetical protein VF535_10790 [Allosphingosinicella sp.]|jgi:hypothetical protein